MRVIIAGAGIAGLTAALSLHAAGIEPLVLDPARELLPLGVGINLLPHAVRELTELGLGGQLAGAGIETAEQAHFDRHGGLIWSEPRGRALGYDWPQYSVHRGELQMILLGAVRERLGGDAVRTATTVTGFTEHDDHVEVRVAARDSAGQDGAGQHDGGQPALAADALIGADGLYSAVRAVLHPGEAPPRWSGVLLWRGITAAGPFLTGATVAICGSNAATKFVAYPVARAAGGRVCVNWVAEAMIGGAGPPSRPDWNRAGRLAEVMRWFADWKLPWLDVPGLIASAPEILEYPMVDRDPLPWWGRGRVTLIGDAAHPMYPIGSNGGSQAIIDARVLAASLAGQRDIPAALAAYERARLEPVNQIVLANRDMPADRVLHAVAVRAPGGFTRVEDVLSAQELAAVRDAYRATSLQDAEALNSRPPFISAAPDA
jgi:2-polyprenyl-6-methoxyphenol hydroxylase-like FAD-dependent oxidoreductase